MIFRRDDVSRENMSEMAADLGAFLCGGDVVILIGDIGAGKTTLVAEMAPLLGAHVQVTSPTFAIVAEYELANEYQGIKKIIHVDTYRLVGVNELYDLGFETIFAPHALTMIEWGERIEEYIDRNHFRLIIEEQTPDTRSFVFEVVGNLDKERSSLLENRLLESGWYQNV